MQKTNPDLLRSYLCFRVFRLSFVSDFFNLLLVKFHEAGMIIVKHFIEGRSNQVWVGEQIPEWPSRG